MSPSSRVLTRVLVLLATAVSVVILLAGFEITVQRKKKGIAKADNQAAIALCKQYPDWSLSDCQLIAQNDIRLYMTDYQVEQSWGKPEKKVTPLKVGLETKAVEVWIYKTAMLTFVDHSLWAIEDTVI